MLILKIALVDHLHVIKIKNLKSSMNLEIVIRVGWLEEKNEVILNSVQTKRFNLLAANLMAEDCFTLISTKGDVNFDYLLNLFISIQEIKALIFIVEDFHFVSKYLACWFVRKWYRLSIFCVVTLFFLLSIGTIYPCVNVFRVYEKDN